MKLLVTGCAGFIGSKVAQMSLEAGHCVVGVDKLDDNYDPRLQSSRLNLLEGGKNFEFQAIDITDRHSVLKVFHDKSFDGVINLAARAGVRASLIEPWDYYDTNLTGTLNLLDACKQNAISKFVLASTSSVYGNGPKPFREDGHSDSTLSPYAASKKAAECLCYSYHHAYGIDISVLRYFTVYGPAGRPDMAIYRFIAWIAEGKPLVLYGDGTQERDFTFVDDIARGTVAALRPLGFEVINLGSDRPSTVNRVIQLIETALTKPAIIKREAPHSADVQATWADITKARNLLSWEPHISLETGIRKAADWYLENDSWAGELCANVT